MTSGLSYARPPILEAVLEFRFEQKLSDRELERTRTVFKKLYPSVQLTNDVNVQVNEQSVTASATVSGARMVAGNGVDMLIFHGTSLSTNRLAPYDGWERLRQRASRNLSMSRKVGGRRALSRIGVRFVNRLDIPAPTAPQLLDRFVRLGVLVPQDITAEMLSYNSVLEFENTQWNARARVQTGPMVPVLIGGSAVGLDIDVYVDRDLPERDDQIWDRVDGLRQMKNHLFERAITNDARELFR